MGGMNSSKSSNSNRGVSQGSQSSRNRSQSAMDSQSFSDAFGFNRSMNQSFNTQDTFVDPAQQGFQQALWGGAFGMANPQGVQNSAMRAAQGMRGGLQDTFNNTAALTDPSAQIAAQEGSLRAVLGNLFHHDLLPSIQRNSQASGGFGGGRQGVMEGQAAGELANAYTSGLGDITARANQTALGAANTMPGLSQALFANTTAPMTAGLDVMGQLGQILGAPTVLSRGRAGSFGNSVGTNRSRSGSQSRSRSRSSGSSKGKNLSWNIGTGGSKGWGFNIL